MSKEADPSFPPWLSDEIRKAAQWAADRKWIADAEREDLVHQVWVYLLDEGETPVSLSGTTRDQLWTRLLTLANRAAASAARAKKRLPQAAALAGVHDGAAGPARAAELRDLIDRIARALRDHPINQRRLVARMLVRNTDSEITRTFAETSGLTEHDFLIGAKAMTPKNRQVLHRVLMRLRDVITCLTLLAVADVSVARAGERLDRPISEPVSTPKPVDRDHWN